MRRRTCWRELLDIRGCPPAIVREATEALAIHHEHRVRDLPAARRSRFSLEIRREDGQPGPKRSSTGSRGWTERWVSSLKFGSLNLEA